MLFAVWRAYACACPQPFIEYLYAVAFAVAQDQVFALHWDQVFCLDCDEMLPLDNKALCLYLWRLSGLYFLPISSEVLRLLLVGCNCHESIALSEIWHVHIWGRD